MDHVLQKRDSRGMLDARECRPGLLEVKLSGHLTASVGQAFPEFARQAAAHSERCEVVLDVRELDSFDPAVCDAWVRVVLEFQPRIDRIQVVSSKLFITMAAQAAGIAVKSMGIPYEVRRAA
jgi:hypothetical protein